MRNTFREGQEASKNLRLTFLDGAQIFSMQKVDLDPPPKKKRKMLGCFYLILKYWTDVIPYFIWTIDVTGIFLVGGGPTSLFPIFSQRGLPFFFPVEIPILVEKQFQWFPKSDKKKKGKKRSSVLFASVFPLHFSFSSFPFPFFLIFFYILNLLTFLTSFPCLVFPISQQKFPARKSMDWYCAPCPCLLCHWFGPLFWGGE